MGKIEDKVHLSPAEAKICAELGKNVLVAANRIQNELERAKMDSSSDDFLE